MAAPGATQSTDPAGDVVIPATAYIRKNQYSEMKSLANPADTKLMSRDTVMTRIMAALPKSIAFRFITGVKEPQEVLDKYPQEVWDEINGHLDIETFFKFRQTSLTAFEITAAQPAFRRVSEKAANTLAAVIRTGMWKHLSFWQIEHALCNPKCEICGKVGHLLYMPTATRVCEHCLHAHDDFATITLASFSKKGGVTKQMMERSAPFPIVKGSYRTQWTGSKMPIDLVKLLTVARAFNIDPNTDFGHGYAGLNAAQQLHARNMATAPLPIYNRVTQEVLQVLNCKGCALRYSHAVENMKGLSFATFALRPAKSPVVTVTRRELGQRKGDACRNYLRHEFLEHVRHCEMAQVLLRASDGGTFSTSQFDTEYVKNGGESLHETGL